jgi:hypothetical protein
MRILGKKPQPKEQESKSAAAILALLALDRFNHYQENDRDVEKIRAYLKDKDPEEREKFERRVAEREAYWASFGMEDEEEDN